MIKISQNDKEINRIFLLEMEKTQKIDHLEKPARTDFDLRQQKAKLKKKRIFFFEFCPRFKSSLE